MMPDMSTIGAFLAMLLGFGFIIFVHELGHFLVAKWVGIKCTQFAICFGHAIFCWRKGIGFRFGSTEPEYRKRIDAGEDPANFGETEYRVNWIPLGGYVKMLGQEDMDPTARSDDPRAYNNKSIGARAAVISAGVIMNMIFALIFFVIAFMAGVAFPPAMVGAVVPGSPAAVAYAQGHDGDAAYLGLQPGDQITHLDSEKIDDFMDLRVAVALASRGQVLELQINRESESGQPLFYRLEPEEGAERLLSIGVIPAISNRLADIRTGGDALSSKGLEPGMEMVEVNGKAITRYDQFLTIVEESNGQKVTAVFADPDSDKRVTIDIATAAQLTASDKGVRNLLGFVPVVQIPADGIVKGSPAEAAGLKGGDVIAQIGSRSWPSTTQLLAEIEASAGKAIDLTVLRDGEITKLSDVTPKANDEGKGKIGAGIDVYTDGLIVSQTLDGSPADSLELPQGTKILAVNGVAVSNYAGLHAALVEAVKASDALPVTLTLDYELSVGDRPQLQSEVTLNDATIADATKPLRYVPAAPFSAVMFEYVEIPVKADTPFAAAALGIEKTGEFVVQTYQTLDRLVVQRTVKPEHLRGPLGIAQTGTTVAKKGWEYLFFFLGLISVNLAVINFLPIPVVDGGHIVFLIIEKIKGSPVSVGVQTAATVAGLVLIGGLFVVVTFFDLTRLIAGG